MNKLELKHLAPYLPHKLQVKCMGEFIEDTDEDNPIPKMFDLIGLLPNKGSVSFHGNKDLFHYEDIFPILRPLSDMTKEYINEYELSFIEHIYCESWMAGGYDLTENKFEYKITSKEDDSELFIYRMKPLTNMYWVVQEMFRYHFDVFGLIEKGLAIDANKL